MATFKVGDKAYFLGDGRSIKSGKTDIRFCFVSSGIIVSCDDDKTLLNAREWSYKLLLAIKFLPLLKRQQQKLRN